MKTVSPYLNFPGTTEEAFRFYRSVFGGDFSTLHRFGDQAGADRDKIMHIALPLRCGTVLMATDACPSMGFTVTPGNNTHILLDCETQAEVDELFAGLSADGTVEMPPQSMPWGSYFANWRDRYGVHWMAQYTFPASDDLAIVTSRVFPVARERMLRAWTDPAIVTQWWGPAGFTNTFTVFDPRPGGIWDHVMHGPDGKDHVNYSVFVEVGSERIVFEHRTAPAFRAIATFIPRGSGTALTYRMEFASAAQCAAVKTYAVDCNEQLFDRLAAQLARLADR